MIAIVALLMSLCFLAGVAVGHFASVGFCRHNWKRECVITEYWNGDDTMPVGQQEVLICTKCHKRKRERIY